MLGVNNPDEHIIGHDVDYYKVLLINKSATESEIREAFESLAIKYKHENKIDPNALGIFALVAEAYDVLSNPVRRAVYDQYGEIGLKRGVPGSMGFIPPYVYHGEPMRSYKGYFNGKSPHVDSLEILTQHLLKYPEGRGIRRKEEPVMKSLSLTLEEVFYGGIKKMRIEKMVLVDQDKSFSSLTEKILTIPIKPGILASTKIIFPCEGDQSPTKIPADIIFVVEDRPHETFKRNGSDLYMKLNIILRDALHGTVITVHTINGRILRIPITDIVKTGYEKTIVREGLPLPNNPHQKGNLILNFEVEFPMYSSTTIKHQAFQWVLDQNTTETDRVQLWMHAEKIRGSIDVDVTLNALHAYNEKLKNICNPIFN